LAGLHTLAQAGHWLGLDLRFAEPEPPCLLALLPVCRVARLSVQAFDVPELGQWQARLAEAGLQTLAAGVDSSTEQHACLQLGFKHLQGSFYLHPQPSAPHRLDGERLRLMQLINRVLEKADIAELEAGFKHDAGLSVRLLRFINSPAIGLRQPIESIAHALMLLGHEPLYRWLTFLLFASGEPGPHDRALLGQALVRARLCELLGRSQLGEGRRGSLFITGMLSLLDALLNLPMAEALASLRLEAPIQAALTGQQGPYAPALALAIACERLDDAGIATWAAGLGLTEAAVNAAHLQAIAWAEGLEV